MAVTSDLFAEQLCKTIIIGLPGIGKTTLTNYLTDQYTELSGQKLQTISTDQEMRSYIADKNNPLTDDFLTARNIPAKEGRDLLKVPASFMEKYGEETFRDFESAVITDLLSKGAFNGKVPDLGGKALLHPKTAAAFKEKGYKSIYIKPEKESILLSHIPPAKTEFKTDGLHLNIGLYQKSIEAGDQQAMQTATAIMRQMYRDRNPKYEKAATDIVFLSGSLKKDAEKIKAVILGQKANHRTIQTEQIKQIRQNGR